MALATLLILLVLPVVATLGFGKAQDASSAGITTVEPLPILEAASELSNPDLETPDLLEGEVPDGVNPTDEIKAAQQAAAAAPKVDALGNPIGNAAGNPSKAPGSKMILIDGQPIGPSSLPPAPLPGLTQPSPFGPVPARSTNGGTAMTQYNRPFNAPAGKRPVSILIGGLGINRTMTQRAIDDLPPEVTLSFAAHATGLQDWINRARTAGHEVMIELPMESAGFNPAEPGADRALRTSLSAPDNRRNLDWLLSRAQGYWGVTNYNGDSFLRRADVVAPVLDRLSQTGLGFVTDGAFSTPTLAALSGSVNLPYKQGFGLIDPDPDAAIISARLYELSSLASAAGHPVGVGFGYPETIDSVLAWAAQLDGQGLVLAPVSSALK